MSMHAMKSEMKNETGFSGGFLMGREVGAPVGSCVGEDEHRNECAWSNRLSLHSISSLSTISYNTFCFSTSSASFVLRDILDRNREP